MRFAFVEEGSKTTRWTVNSFLSLLELPNGSLRLQKMKLSDVFDHIDFAFFSPGSPTPGPF